MFRAISYILWGNEEEHKSLRDMVVRHVRENWQEYGPFVVAEWNISNPHEYFEFMNSDGIYASELECIVATRLHHMNLSIYRVVHGKHEIKRVFHNSVHDDYRTARLLFSGRSDSGHYDVLLMDY
ncbi:uncharacterized protein LOC107264378 [Cephus cinctus]|uniref:Uncharacterized protein LOC107264378 n=1 Tax=Cephus cinctus TaxID=211228 RepID=A0AAJ7BK40_CEPCN|nr:uncharacterized protein LOC107264378 [Cephus cinctus]